MTVLSYLSALSSSLLVSGLSGSCVVLVSGVSKTLRYGRVHVNRARGADVAVAPRSVLAARTEDKQRLRRDLGFYFSSLIFYFEVFPDFTFFI